MITVESKKVPISKIKLNPDNPRAINDKDLTLLIQSLEEFPEMVELREIIVDECMTIIGGNMRFMGLEKIGVKYCFVKIVKGLTNNQKREFIIKDNLTSGEWNFDDLANMFSNLPLVDWGVKGMDFGSDDPKSEWEDMPEFNDDGEAIKSIIIFFDTEQDVNDFSGLINQQIEEKTKYIWFPKREKKIRKDTVVISES